MNNKVDFVISMELSIMDFILIVIFHSNYMLSPIICIVIHHYPYQPTLMRIGQTTRMTSRQQVHISFILVEIMYPGALRNNKL